MADTSGTKQKNYSLTPAEIKYFQSHPFSFRSLSGGFFRCNQIDRFGKLTKTAVVGIQGQLTRHHHSSQKPEPAIAPAVEEPGSVVLPPPKGSWDKLGSFIYCPRCNRAYEYWHLTVGAQNFCTTCKMPFMAPDWGDRLRQSVSDRFFSW